MSASSSHSTTSSPDVLGPEGDALYLISSPVPDFRGRQSWLPPYTVRTPRRQERLPSRSPSKSAQTLRFDDILLPPKSPTRPRSTSPTKMQSDGSLSPWRIRVTVEAEQDEDEQNPRKKLKPSTITTKVPLKDEEGNTPSEKRRRGRPRKSDLGATSSSPIKGSPGHTPRLKPSTHGKRPRGRPRKSLQSETIAQSIETDHHPETAATLETLHDIDNGNSPVPFLVEDEGSVADSQPDSDPFLDMVESGSLNTEQQTTNIPRRFSPSGSENSPIQRKKGVRVIEGASELTPIKSLAAVRRNQAVSPENTLHAGHTPRLRRSYPTPASSSLVDELQENQKMQQLPDNEDAPILVDPTDEHNEFDTIMESEGFSMVSLDSLPSAKQAGLSSILNTAKGALKPFYERQKPVPFNEKSRTSTLGNNTTETSSLHESRPIESDPAQTSTTRGSERVMPDELKNSRKELVKTFDGDTPHQVRADLRSGEGFSRTQTEAENNRVLEIDDEEEYELEEEEGVEGEEQEEVVMEEVEGEEQEEEDEEEEEEDDDEEEEEQVEKNQEKEEEDDEEEEGEETEPRHSNILLQKESVLQHNSPQKAFPSLSQREAEWQHEREVVSQQINMAASSDVIVLGSDEDAESQPEEELTPLHNNDGDDDEQDEDGDFDDIWQEEARDRSFDKRSGRASRAEEKSIIQSASPKRTERQGSNTDYNTYYKWNPDKGEIPPLGRSRMAQLQDEEIDLSFLLRPRDTPKSRKYYANSSPHTVASQKSQSKPNATLEIVSNGRRSPREVRLSQGLNRADTSMRSGVRGRETHDDRTYQEENEEDEEEEEEGGEQDEERNDEVDAIQMSDQRATPEHDSEIQHSVVTPDPGTPVSKPSWFRRLTNNVTPSWWAKQEKEQFIEEQPLDESLSPPFNGNIDELYSRVTESTPNLKRAREPEPEHLSSGDIRHQPHKKARSVTLATSGYFTDAHYTALRRLYSTAKRFPEKFPYHSNAHRDEMIGDSLWTSDGEHGLPIAEIQFGILDRFVSDLSEADLRNGGSGEIGWTEDDLHKRLFSIIVGEQIRREQKEQETHARR